MRTYAIRRVERSRRGKHLLNSILNSIPLFSLLDAILSAKPRWMHSSALRAEKTVFEDVLLSSGARFIGGEVER